MNRSPATKKDTHFLALKMVMEQYLQEAEAQNESVEYGASVEKWNSVSATVDESEDNPSIGFDCNICLDSVQDPVVTLCGHLYCWPCIYKWIHFQSVSAENPDQQKPQCPVCKAEVSQRSLVPLYGRGQTAKSSETKSPHLGIVVPRRPPSPTSCGVHTLITTADTTNSHPAQQLRHRRSQPYHLHSGGYAAMPMLSLDGTPTTDVIHPMVGMFGEMVYARIFGNSETTSYAYPNSYHLAGSNSPRVRRHIMKAEKSLSRICFFLCCCIVLCLLLF
ncbi:unnamed protein product [Camellia sinensis]